MSVEANNKPSTYLPYFGVALGTTLGSVSNFFHNHSFFTKDCVEKVSKAGKVFFTSGATCRSGPYGKDSFLTTINRFKQNEISTFALATPFIPLVIPAYNLLSDSIANRDPNEAFYISVPKNIGKELAKTPISRIGHQTALVVGSFVANGILGYLAACPNLPLHSFHSNGSNFDVSGHVILKMTLASCLVNSLNATQSSAGKTQAATCAIFAGIVAATDAIMMYNTGQNCHTVAEVLTGFAAASAVHLAASGVERLITWWQKPSTPPLDNQPNELPTVKTGS